MAVQVTFIYCEEAQRWQTLVRGNIADACEAVQAFSSVVLTCQQLQPLALPYARALETKASDGCKVYQIVPAVCN